MLNLQNKSIAINTLSQSLARVGTIIISLLTTSILSRVLGKSGYGQFGLITTAVLFFASISDWGTQAISVREASRQGSDRRSIFANSIILRFAQSVLVTVLFVIFSQLYPSFQDFRIAALVAFPLIIIISLRTSSQIIHQTKLKMFIPSIAEFLTSLFFLFILIYFTGRHVDITLFHVILAILISTLIGSLFSFIPIIGEFNLSKFQSSTINRLIRESLPMGFFLVVFSIYNRIDTFLLQSIQGDTATGIYVLSYKVHENFVVFAAYLMNSVYPIISRSQEGSKQVFKSLFSLLFISGLLVLFVGLTSSNLIIKVLGGGEFIESVLPLRILFFATFISFLNHLTGYTLIASGKQRISLLFASIALVVNILLNLLLIPKFSYTAAATVTVLTELTMFILSMIYLYKKQNYRVSLANMQLTIRELAMIPFKPFL